MAKNKAVKSDEVRVAEISEIRRKLSEVGIVEFPADLDRVLADFERGYGWSGTIKIPELRVKAVIKLSTQPHIESGLTLTKL